MFTDARSIADKKKITTDICIVGAGAAGITIAREFANTSVKVVLLESGGLNPPDSKTRALNRGKYSGRGSNPLHNRARIFGGTTALWNGWCRPLDEIDFEQRDGIPYSGWPFRKQHLMPFYKRAHSLLGIGPFNYQVKPSEIQRIAESAYLSTPQLITTNFQFSRPILRFGKAFRNEIDKAANINTCLNANVTNVEPGDAVRSIHHVDVKCLEGNTFQVFAKIFILAAGALENARLLLLSNKKQVAGLGNQNDLVGRFFMAHPHVHTGQVLLSNPQTSLAFYSKYNRHNHSKIKGLLSLSDEMQRREKILNFSVKLSYLPDSTHLEHLSNVIFEIDGNGSHNDQPGGRGKPDQVQCFSLINRSQQLPSPESRLTLDPEKDSLGLNMAKLNWQFVPEDYHLLKRGNEIIAQEFGRLGLGRMLNSLEDKEHWPRHWGGGHHIGVTRMHADPKQGVVDPDCMVHGLSNLYIAGPSVFPTGGYANPVLTILALSIRLSDHIKNIFV